MLAHFAPSEEHELFRSAVRAFAQSELAPHSARWDAEDRLPPDAVAAMAGQGLLGIISPAELGGGGKDYLSLGIAIEEIARADLSCAIICWIENTLANLIPGWGDETIRQVNRGETLLALATSERDAGSDVSGMETTAELDGDEYILNGLKIHVSLVPGADLLGVTAKTSAAGVDRGISMFIVRAAQAGVSCAPMEQLGVRAHQLGEVRLDRVRVPSSAILGKGGSGKRVMNVRFNVSRCLSPLAAVGAASAALDATLAFAKRKVVFGRPLATNQSISFSVAEHYTRLDAARLLAYRALWLNDRGVSSMKEAAMAKWFGITNAVDAVSDCLAMHGAGGYLKELPLEQQLRDVMAMQFTGGTTNVMKMILVRELFGKEFAGIA